MHFAVQEGNYKSSSNTAWHVTLKKYSRENKHFLMVNQDQDILKDNKKYACMLGRLLEVKKHNFQQETKFHTYKDIPIHLVSAKCVCMDTCIPFDFKLSFKVYIRNLCDQNWNLLDTSKANGRSKAFNQYVLGTCCFKMDFFLWSSNYCESILFRNILLKRT